MRKIKEWIECPYGTQALVGSYYCTYECKHFFGEKKTYSINEISI